MTMSVTLWLSFMNVPEVSCSIDISCLVFISYQMCLQRLTHCQLQCLLNTSCPDTLNILLQWQHMVFCFRIQFGHWSVHAVVSVLVTSYKTWNIAS
jgi:hypothetical protein